MEPVKTDEQLQEIEEKHQLETEQVNLAEVKDPNIQKLLGYYPPDMVKDLQVSKFNADKMIRMLKNVAVDNSVPQLCLGPECLRAKVCPIANVGPVGTPCPIEQIIMEKDIDDYKVALGLDEFDRIEYDQLMELVEADIMDKRASADIAVNGYTVQNLVYVTEDGKPVYQDTKSIAMEIKNFYKKRKDKVIKDFVKTKEMKLKYSMIRPEIDDPSKRAARLRKLAEDAKFEEEKDASG